MLNNLNNILVAVDRSAASKRAFWGAVELTKALKAKLTLVHALDVFDPASPDHPVVPVDSYSLSLDKLMQENYERQWAEFVQQSEDFLKQKQAEAKAEGVTAYYLQPYGRPGPAICKVAETIHADLIVVGSRGRSGFRELILGSVSNYIMHHAPCSVTVIHPDSYADPADPMAQEQPAAVATTV
jgi:nucleotide-binding universal stress UspA family protein